MKRSIVYLFAICSTGLIACQDESAIDKHGASGVGGSGGSSGGGGSSGQVPDAAAPDQPSVPAKRDCQYGAGTASHGKTVSCGSNIGQCRTGLATCEDGVWSACVGEIKAAPAEVCDADFTDENCNGTVNEGCECVNPKSGPLWSRVCGPSTDVGECSRGVQLCVDNKITACTGEVVFPAAELCDGKDNDCDGQVDEDFKVGVACTGVGECGVSAGVFECDGTNAARCSTNPGGSQNKATFETCDGKDNDCDGRTDEDYFVGVICTAMGACAASAGKYECSGSFSYRCSTGPGGSMSLASATDSCGNLVDDDCDGQVNEMCACLDSNGPLACGPTAAQAGVGVCRYGTMACVNGAYTACAGAVMPSAELCNGKDDDCDGLVDEDWNVGASCSGKGECTGGKIECVPGNVYATRCSSEPTGSSRKDAPEVCDGKDNDCDGQVDEDYFVGAPCKESGACASFPGTYECNGLHAFRCSTGPKGSADKSSPEICTDLVDNDCNGVVNDTPPCECKDGDKQLCGPSDAEAGKGICKYGTRTCAGGKWGACLNAVTATVETCNGLDDDCDGLLDEDYNVGGSCTGTGECGTFAGSIECVPGNVHATVCSVNPGGSKDKSKPELCDGKDNDCDGEVDETFGIGQSCTALGACGAGAVECATTSTVRCSSGPGGSASKVAPEVCDAGLVDEDCDGLTNETCMCTPTVPATQLSCGASNVGECRLGTQSCSGGSLTSCSGNVNPVTEVCDGKDNDCDGATDDGFALTSCTAPGICGSGTNECAGPGAVRCDVGPGGSKDKSKQELCNGLDDDCDGQVDEDFFVGAPCDGKGKCGAGVLQCLTTTSTVCSTMPGGSANQADPSESCGNLVDDDCDGSVNEGCACTFPSPPFSCGTSNVGECRLGTQSCQSNGTLDTCMGNVEPSPELCDGKDNNCNGTLDEGFSIGTACDGVGACGTGVRECATSGTTRCSTDPGGSQDQSVPELCDGIDNDCNGFFDENGVCSGPPPPPSSMLNPSIGTISCADGGATITVTVSGTVSSGLMQPPGGTITNLALGADIGSCWSVVSDCFPVAVNPPPVDGTTHTFPGVPKTKFTPRARESVSANYFDLNSWTITGSCRREGCAGCRPGETCLPPPPGKTGAEWCIINGL